MSLRILTGLIGLAIVVMVRAESPDLQGESDVVTSEFPGPVMEILRERCFQCHGPDESSAELRLDTLSTDLTSDRRAAERWSDALHIVQRGEMPPDDADDLTPQQRRVLTEWIQDQLDLAISQSQREHRTTLRRMNRAEYEYTLSDLLGVSGDFGANLPADPVSEDGFKNNADVLTMSALQLEYYLDAAREALDDAIVQGDEPERTESTVQSESEKGVFGRRSIKSRESKQLGRTQVFAARFDQQHADGTSQLPADGRFNIRIRARADLKPNQAAPVMQVVYGHKAPGANADYRKIGEMELLNDELATYEFVGLVHRFPNALDIGEKWFQFVGIRNVLDDAGDLPPALFTTNKKNKKKKQIGFEVDPDFPKIHIESVQVIGNETDPWPPESHRKIFYCDQPREIIHSFLTRAWRRPATESETSRYLQHFEAITAQGIPFEEAIKETLAASLASSNFLYLNDAKYAGSSNNLNDFELASRLSYFLWSSMPDDRLTRLAAEGKLSRTRRLAAEAERMLADPKSERFIDQFTAQWLDLEGLDRVAVNPQFYPEFDETLKGAMAGESRSFFSEILRRDLSAMALLDSNWTMANAALARHYGLPTGAWPKSQKFERVSLLNTKRPGGLIGHAAMHLANSNGEDSHPVNRAVWIRERLLNDPPQPPPPNVPAIDSTDPNFASKSVREQLELHRQDPACDQCHRSIDPWGIALEHFDAVGLWRDQVFRPGRTKKIKHVDAQDILPGGVQINGATDLQNYLANDCADRFAEALASKMLAYAVGRSLEFSDGPIVKELGADFRDHDHQLKSLIKAVVVSDAFRQR